MSDTYKAKKKKVDLGIKKSNYNTDRKVLQFYRFSFLKVKFATPELESWSKEFQEVYSLVGDNHDGEKNKEQALIHVEFFRGLRHKVVKDIILYSRDGSDREMNGLATMFFLEWIKSKYEVKGKYNFLR